MRFSHQNMEHTEAPDHAFRVDAISPSYWEEAQAAQVIGHGSHSGSSH